MDSKDEVDEEPQSTPEPDQQAFNPVAQQFAPLAGQQDQVAVHDPSASVGPARNHRALSYSALLFSILFSVIAISYSRKVDLENANGNFPAALKASRKAFIWSALAYVIGISAFIYIRSSH
jgi:hypothetical protein